MYLKIYLSLTLRLLDDEHVTYVRSWPKHSS